MSQVVGVYTRRSAADAARQVLMGAGYVPPRLTLLSPDEAEPQLRRRSESMIRSAVLWGIIGALVSEVPLVIALLLVPADVNVKVLLASTVWKFGATFGAWIGAMAGSDRGLESETASRYERLLRDGKWILSAAVRPKHRSLARGAMLESDAVEVQDVRGTFEIKATHTARRVRHRVN